MSENIADYAVVESLSRGRKYAEKAHPYRSAFERDRDRIIHCSAFRRLEGKTQVFTPGLDDHYRTRLTHTIEVSQIARTIAGALGLNRNLTEAICLAHDLGHSPFGHNGEKVLDELASGFGGFEHNRQSLRIVELLEHPYPDFAGLNLMYETRLGLAKHKSRYDNPFWSDFTETNCTLEGQVADIADRIAYNCHDLEDGMRAEIISDAQLRDIRIFNEARIQINAEAIEDDIVRRTRTVKAIMDMLVSDCINTSKKNIDTLNISTLEQVYLQEENIIDISTENTDKLAELEVFLFRNFYQAREVIQTADEIKSWLSRLFKKFCKKPQLMPTYYQKLVAEEGLERTVIDYLAGMTDRFCLKMLDD